MQKTRQIETACKFASVNSESYNTIMVKVEEPDMDQVFEDIHKDDLADFVQDKYTPGDLFTEKQLEAWAEENGYVKQ